MEAIKVIEKCSPVPRLSFILPAYKSAYLACAINSILEQTEKDIELVVVDDCSPDDILGVVNSFNDSRLSYYRNTGNIGGTDLVRQWNHCLSFAKGEWVVLAADDDLYDPRFCSECLKLAEKYPQVDVIRSRVLQIDETGRPLWDDGKLSEFTNKFAYLYDWLTAKAFTCIGNFMFRRSALAAIGGFMDFPCAFGSDIATPIALSVNGVANTEEMLFSFRQSSQHLSSDSSRFKEKLQGITKLSNWLSALDYGIPENEEDRRWYMVHSEDYLHKKCVYDYFNLVIQYVPVRKLWYIKYCEHATFADRFMIIFRWIKRNIDHLFREKI